MGATVETQVDEIAAGVFRLSTFTDQMPGGFTFNQFLVAGDGAANADPRGGR